MSVNFLSILVPAHNEKESIEKCLVNIMKTELWKNMNGRREIVVCANACTDNTVEIVRKMTANHREIRVIESEVKSKNNAWNLLVKHSNRNSEYLFFVDADVIVKRNSFSELAKALGRNKNVFIAGMNPRPFASMIPREKVKNLYALQSKQLRRSRDQKIRQGTVIINGGGYAIRRKTAVKIKMPEDNRIPEDMFLNYLFFPERTMRVEKAVFYYRPTASFNDRVKQKVRAYEGNKALRQLFPQKRRFHGAPYRNKVKYFFQQPLDMKLALAYSGLTDIYAYLKFKTTKKAGSWPKVNSTKLAKKKKRW